MGVVGEVTWRATSLTGNTLLGTYYAFRKSLGHLTSPPANLNQLATEIALYKGGTTSAAANKTCEFIYKNLSGGVLDILKAAQGGTGAGLERAVSVLKGFGTRGGILFGATGLLLGFGLLTGATLTKRSHDTWNVLKKRMAHDMAPSWLYGGKMISGAITALGALLGGKELLNLATGTARGGLGLGLFATGVGATVVLSLIKKVIFGANVIRYPSMGSELYAPYLRELTGYNPLNTNY